MKTGDPGAAISGLLIVDANGQPTEVIHPPKLRLESYAIDYLVDFDGDGTDEIAYTSSYYEGAYEYLLRRDAGSYQGVLLAGDGA